MTRTRWTGLFGVLLAAVLMGVNVFAGSTPDSSSAGAADKYQRYWSDTDHQDRARIAAFILTYACVLLLAFAAGLRERLRAVDAGPLPSYVLAAGTAAAALIAAGGLVGLSVAFTAADSSSFKIDGSSAMQFDNLSYAILGTGLMAAATMAVAVSLVTLRTKVLPVWTAWLGFLFGLCAVGSLFTVWTGFIALPAWSVVIGVVLLVRSDAVEAPASA